MKSSIRRSVFAAAYRLLDRVSPTDGDCGLLCGSACCCAGEEDAAAQGFNLGIYLLPGEEKLFAKRDKLFEWSSSKAEDGDFPASWRGDVYFIRCKTPPVCKRNMRPFQCRFFPLAPHFDADGALRMILFPMEHLPYECPLISEKYPLSESFIRASHTVWKRLITDPLIRDLVEYDSRERDESELVFLTF